ncbi:hypothetical protein D5F11_022245 [Siminovitchia terrae]|uniref:Uncharacterized protein n=1 Tax=Siminovitchia terrae TaxID=1914933 RepID=A0A429X273_SIMTE|nr:hypothetical protein [Siminovitchia terrae]RST57542.1 hypothetical protein D5F11_022245 [Siminovitchia terrae]
MVFHSLGGGKPRLNKVKASGGCHRFSEEIYRAKLDKIWAQIRQGAFDLVCGLIETHINTMISAGFSYQFEVNNYRS